MDSLRLMDTVALGSSIVGSSGVALASSSVAALSARSLPQPAADSNHNLSPTKNSHLFNTHHYQLASSKPRRVDQAVSDSKCIVVQPLSCPLPDWHSRVAYTQQTLAR